MTFTKNEIIVRKDDNGVITYYIYNNNLLRKVVSKKETGTFYGTQLRENDGIMAAMPEIFAEKCWHYYHLEHHMKNQKQKLVLDGLYKKIEDNGNTTVFELHNKGQLVLVVKKEKIENSFKFSGVAATNGNPYALSHDDAQKKWEECEKEYNRPEPMVEVNKNQEPKVENKFNGFKRRISSLFNLVKNR